MLGASFLLNAWIASALFRNNPVVAEVSAFTGSLLLIAPILFMAIRDIFKAQLHMCALVAIAVLAAFIHADYQIAGLVSFLMLLAIAIQTQTAEGAHASIESLIRLAPRSAARLKHDGSEESIAIDDLNISDHVRVLPGEIIPVDGTIVEGYTTLNEATITGESLPVDKGLHAEVFAGTQNLTGMVTINVSRVGEDTTLGRVQELILAAERTRLPVTQIIDRFISIYLPTILMLTIMMWIFTGNIQRLIAMLIISCPCALVLSTPAAMIAALSACARLGVLVKNVAHLEVASSINAFVFDKTGTLTTGNLSVGRLAPSENVSAAELLHTAASAEQFSKHPIAHALLSLANEVNVKLEYAEQFNEKPGFGISAIVSGSQIFAGRKQWLTENHISTPFLTEDAKNEQENFSILWIAKAGVCIGWIGFQDHIRKAAKLCIDELKDLNAEKIVLITGDRASVANYVASEIGVQDINAECLPEEKVTVINKLRQNNYHVAAIGDGINDAPALASGDIGIAMGAEGVMWQFIALLLP